MNTTTIKRIIVACDQSTGASSAFGLCVFDGNTDTILATHELRPQSKSPAWQRIKEISYQLNAIFDGTYKTHGPLEIRVENFTMRGLSGQMLAWMVGTVIAHLPPNCTFVLVHNIKLKVFITGKHNASKQEMGQGLLEYFKKKNKSPSSIDTVSQLLQTNSWDAIDAICIAVYSEDPQV